MSEEKIYPEHEKLAKVQDKSQAIGEFLEWLWSEKKVYLAVEGKYETHTMLNYRTNKLLADFFSIDENKLENEKIDMLASLKH